MTVTINGTDNSASTPAVTGTDGDTGMFYPAANTVALSTGGSERMRIDSDGDVGIGTTSPAQKLHLAATTAGINIQITNDAITTYLGQGGTGSTTTDLQTNGALRFNTGASFTERMRINSSGQVLVGQTSSPTANFAVTANVGPDPAYIFTNASTSSVSYDMFFQKSAAAPNSTGARFLTCVDTSADRLIIQSNGSVINATGSYGTISDQKLKQDIVDAGSQWDDIKNLRFRKYRLKTDVEANPDAKPFLGLVAQEVELVSPGLVDESPDVSIETGDLGTTTKQIKTSVLYMKAIKALQEAMERIETLEAKVAALEGAE
jgi:hypothetical protein